jgi:hypothetical protein
MKTAVLNVRLWLGSATSLLALSGCGDPPPQKPQLPASGGLTIELPEPVPAARKVAPSADEANVAEAKPVPVEEPPPPAAADQKDSKEKSPPWAEPEPQPTTPPEAAPVDDAEATPAASAETTRPPLPNSVMARTLDRIGFRCGSVTSAVRLDDSGEPSAFKITCSSGQSYRASNKTGRYRFTKWRGAE